MPTGLKGNTDAWFKAYEDTKELASETLALIQERNVKYPTGGQEASRITATARRKLGSLGSAVEALRDILESPECASVVFGTKGFPQQKAEKALCDYSTETEKNVRRDMITTLKSSREQMLQALRRDQHSQSRESLLKNSNGASSSQPHETNRTAELDNRGMLQMQHQVIAEQDYELAQLEKTVTSTKHIALTINEELGLQERLLEELDEDVDVSHSRMKAAQKKLNKVLKQSGNCKTMLITIGLMFVLMILIVICFKIGKLL